MAMLVVLLAQPEMESIGTSSIRRLADLGVTRVGVFRDGLGVAITLEGWAYDPAGSADATLGLVAADAKEVRTLVQVADVAVSKELRHERIVEAGERLSEQSTERTRALDRPKGGPSERDHRGPIRRDQGR